VRKRTRLVRPSKQIRHGYVTVPSRFLGQRVMRLGLKRLERLRAGWDDMSDIAAGLAATKRNLQQAVHRNRALSRAGLAERLFTLAFRGLVYPQIWEDPLIDMEALAIGEGDRVVTIASGGCNVLSCLVAAPAHVTALDLNGAHVALTRLKLKALQSLPDHESFFAFFGRGESPANIGAYRRLIAPKLDEATRAYWEGRMASGRQRIWLFKRNPYRHGLLGRFITLAHLLSRLHGIDPRRLLEARSKAEQAAIFESYLAPLFDKPFVRWLTRRPASLYGLGIPPSQFVELSHAPEAMAQVLRERLRRLACDFDLRDNYFARQAFGRGYGDAEGNSLPPYLEKAHFDALRARADRVDVRQMSFTHFLQRSPESDADCFVLLDAQDWMSDADLTELWTQMTRVARPGARVIFRTAGCETILPGRVPDRLLRQWTYEAARSRDLAQRDRSAIYGGFHLYVKTGDA
jgi:S-adenosylmethionine-diacylglycerol 3-amino-3-carboxypropyl transferase